MQDIRAVRIGHISSYDKATNHVRVVMPDLTDQNGVPIVSPWMPLGVPMVGAGFGMLYYPHGGATPDNPAIGEQVTVLLLERDSGFSFSASMHYTSIQPPPTPTDFQPGEFLIRHESSAFVRMYKNGDIGISAANDMFLLAANDVTVAAGRDLNLSAQRDIIALAGQNITGEADKESIQFTAKKNFTVQAERNISMAAEEDFNALASKDMSLTAQENLDANAKKVSIQASDDASLLATKTITIAGGTSVTTSARTVTIDADTTARIQGGQHAYLTAAAVNIYAAKDLGPSISTTLSTRTRPATQEAISDIKINGKSVSILRGAVARIFNQNDVAAGNQKGIPIMNGPANAEIILGGRTVTTQNPAFSEAKDGEVIVDADNFIKLNSKKKIDIIAKTNLKIDSQDAVINSSRTMAISSPSIKIRAINQTDSDLTLLGSRINISTSSDFTDTAYKQIGITTPTDGDMLLTSGGKLTAVIADEIDISSTNDCSIHTTGGGNLFLGLAQAGPITIDCNNTMSILSASGVATTLIGGQGINTFKKLMTEDFLDLYNAHEHSGIFPGSGNSGAPLTPGTADVYCTHVLEAA